VYFPKTGVALLTASPLDSQLKDFLNEIHQIARFEPRMLYAQEPPLRRVTGEEKAADAEVRINQIETSEFPFCHGTQT
jgi:hypothetical protein